MCGIGGFLLGFASATGIIITNTAVGLVALALIVVGWVMIERAIQTEENVPAE